MNKELTIDLEKLKDLCCQVYEINYDDLFGPCRKRNIVDARRAFYFILKTEYKLSELSISRLTNNSRDHSTIIHLNETTNDLLYVDYNFASRYKILYECYTLRQFTRPIPKKPTDVTTREHKIYRYYTDDMLAKSKTKFAIRFKFISNEYKNNLMENVRKYNNISLVSRKFGVTKDFVESLIKHMS